jgi:hypothetical protein
MTSQAVACTLTAEQQRCESEALLPGLAARATTTEWTSSGIRFSFLPSSDTIEAISMVIDRERKCCSFLDFQLNIPAGGNAFLLELRGPPGTREFLSELLGHSVTE